MAQQQVVVAHPGAAAVLNHYNAPPGGDANAEVVAAVKRRRLSENLFVDGLVSRTEHGQALAAENAAWSAGGGAGGGPGAGPPWAQAMETRLNTRIDAMETRLSRRIENESIRQANHLIQDHQPLEPLKQPSSGRIPDPDDEDNDDPHFPATKNDLANLTHEQCNELLHFYEMQVPVNSTLPTKRQKLRKFIHR